MQIFCSASVLMPNFSPHNWVKLFLSFKFYFHETFLQTYFWSTWAFLDFRVFNFRNFWFYAVYNSILFSSPLVLLSNLDLRGFRFPLFFMCPHINGVNRGMPVVCLIYWPPGFEFATEKEDSALAPLPSASLVKI